MHCYFRCTHSRCGRHRISASGKPNRNKGSIYRSNKYANCDGNQHTDE
jgi:hypothetical protein